MKSDQVKYLSTKAAALLLGVSLRTVQLWVENGTLRAWKTAGGHRRIPEDSVQKLMNKKAERLSQNKENKDLLMLVVEDDTEVRDAYCMSISMTGLPITVMTAENGFEALIKAGKYHPDIIMTDLMMPHMDGFEMIKAINRDKDINPAKLIVVTAMDKADRQVKLLAVTAVTLFHKPLDINKLEDLLKQHIGEQAYV